jgi:hypothetical protein
MPLSQMLAANPPKLDPEEQHFHIASPLQGLRLRGGEDPTEQQPS